MWGQSTATMCELGSQGGMDGRWHCSAAQVEILLFQHADILLFMLSHFLSLPSCIFFPSCHCASVPIIVSACSIDRRCKEGDGWGGGTYISLVHLMKFCCSLMWFKLCLACLQFPRVHCLPCDRSINSPIDTFLVEMGGQLTGGCHRSEEGPW